VAPGSAYISLATACLALYREQTDVLPDVMHPSVQAVFDEVARAIAQIVPIYARREADAPREISQGELMDGRFVEGGRILVTSAGSEIRGLVIRRADLATASRVLIMAGVTFPYVKPLAGGPARGRGRK
jgi:hypothetical protein